MSPSSPYGVPAARPRFYGNPCARLGARLPHRRLTVGNRPPVPARDNEDMRRVVRMESLLAHLPLLQGLPPRDLARIADATDRIPLARGDVLFRQGDAVTGFHAVVYGRVKLLHRGTDGRDRVVDVVEPKRSFGEPVMFLDRPYIVTAVALADTLVLRVRKDAVLAELARNPALASRIIGMLAQRIEALVHELHDAAVGTGAHRFIGWVLRQPAAQAVQGAAVVTLPTAKRLLAARLKVSPEHLSRILGELVDAGLIAVRGRDVLVPDVARLRDWQLESA